MISEDGRVEKATALLNTNKRKYYNVSRYMEGHHNGYFQETMFSHYQRQDRRGGAVG